MVIPGESNDEIPMVDTVRSSPGNGLAPLQSTSMPKIPNRSFPTCGPVISGLMLEIKDKEKSALVALAAARHDPRLVTGITPDF